MIQFRNGNDLNLKCSNRANGLKINIKSHMRSISQSNTQMKKESLPKFKLYSQKSTKIYMSKEIILMMIISKMKMFLLAKNISRAIHSHIKQM